MKRSLLPLSLLLAAALLAGCGHRHDDASAGASDSHAHADADILVPDAVVRQSGFAVETVRPAAFPEVVAVSGRVLPARGDEATVAATMAGIVTPAPASLAEGAAVTRGQTLFVVSAAGMADGNPAAAAAAELAAAQADYRRMEQLVADGLATARELDEARRRYETARAAAASLGDSGQRRAVAAPLTGYVRELLVRSGDYVTAGQPLATVVQSRRLQLRADVPLRHQGILPRVAGASFRPAGAADGRVYDLDALGGRLLSRGRAGASDDFYVPVVFEFDNSAGLVPGSYAEVWLRGAPRAGVLSLPVSALTEEQGVLYVYVQTSSHSFRKQEVAAGATDGSRVEITAGLRPGDKVVTRGAVQVKLAAAAALVPEGHSHDH